MNLAKISSTMAILCSSFLLSQPVVLAQALNEKTIDSWLRNNSNEVAVGLSKWMGPYQTIKKTNGGYIANYAKGSLPITVIDQGIDVGCPQTREPLSKAPEKLRKIFTAKCPGLKS